MTIKAQALATLVINADGYSPTVTTGTSSDGSTTVTVTNKDGSSTTELVDGTARKDAADAAKTATLYITDINENNGIKVAAKDNTNNYLQVNSSGMSVCQDINNSAIQVASLGANGIVLGIDKNAQTIVTADGIKIANADGIIGVSVDSSGTSQVATKVVNVYASIRNGSSYTLTLDSSIASGTSLEFRVELDGYPEFGEWFTIAIGTNKSGTFSDSNSVRFTYTYNATNRQITITASGGDDVVLCFYRYDVVSDLPLVQLNGVIEFNGEQQKDMIVEQGTSGIWTYRKYSSGIIECWTTKQWSTPTLTMSAISSSGTYKSQTLSMPFPTDLFTDVENCFNVRFSFMSSGTYLLSVMNSAPSNSVLPVVIVKGGSSTAACSIYAHAVGRWK